MKFEEFIKNLEEQGLTVGCSYLSLYIGDFVDKKNKKMMLLKTLSREYMANIKYNCNDFSSEFNHTIAIIEALMLEKMNRTIEFVTYKQINNNWI